MPPVKLDKQPKQVTISNRFFNITLSTPDGQVMGISYGGVQNILSTQNDETNRGYWDTVWSNTNPRSSFSQKFIGTSFEVIIHNENQTEISFKRKWNASQSNQPPLNIDKRFIMLRDTPGFYTYSIVERLKGWPISSIQNIRLVFRLQTNMFNYMVVSDERQRVMPTDVDRNKGKVLGYKEAVLLTNPTNPDLKGEVDDKYFYSNDDKDGKVYGWISSTNPPLGFWMINPSNEYRIGGPLKQDLTTHVGPTVLTVFCSTHYAGEDLAIKFQQEEAWKKVIGPVFVYLNSNAAAKANPSILWNDAKKRMNQEVASWPYEFALSKDYIKSNQRGTVRGQLFVNDSKQNVAASNAYIGLGPPGEAGSWQRENKGYQFWTKTDGEGNFIIENVIFGTYNLYAIVPGFIGDYKYTSNIKVTPGSNIKLGTLIYKPPRNGATIWEIGIPDRTAAEFFIPNPPSQFKVHKYKNNSESKFRQYGLWEQYDVLYPKNDLVYNVGTSNYSRDWFYAQVTRKIGNKTYKGTSWKIIFNLANVNIASNYTLQLARAAAHEVDLHVLVNDEKIQEPHFSTGHIGGSNAIARHGIHGLYWLYSIGIQGKLLVKGTNTIFLVQSSGLSPFEGVMYDYIRFEGPHQ
ncbi:hypothetical protein R3W88_028600 [Solanum pinnatisectum]|uniref:rhamnogalacturonan endolyase n=1 Tax=Solanum pinnatisectum TaxID=50273 RepID=A0AAV9K534_9SOLN|nr:hypothetical protein R3W88_028600 [Solanum pinnatisectum]